MLLINWITICLVELMIETSTAFCCIMLFTNIYIWPALWWLANVSVVWIDRKHVHYLGYTYWGYERMIDWILTPIAGQTVELASETKCAFTKIPTFYIRKLICWPAWALQASVHRSLSQLDCNLLNCSARQLPEHRFTHSMKSLTGHV